MVYENWYCFNESLRVGIRAHPYYFTRYFEHEYQDLETCKSSLEPTTDILLQIGGARDLLIPEPEFLVKRTINKILNLHYAISELGNGKTLIWVEDQLAFRVAPELTLPIVQTSILEPVIYIQSLLQGRLILHAAAVARDDKGLIIAARGGTGKTTTSLRLLQTDPELCFMGDDLLFVNGNGGADYYPRPLHLFRHHLRDLHFLQVNSRLRLKIILRHLLRQVLQKMYRIPFFLSTRVNIKDAVPGVKIVSRTIKNKLILLEPSKEIQQVSLKDAEERQNMSRLLLDTSDLRETVFAQYLGERPALKQQVESMEKQLMDNFLLHLDAASRIGRSHDDFDEVLSHWAKDFSAR
ncbi:MAG TPA: hypothetical protein ENN32_02385 [Chloroflexi bacterium]|nr:hypothetical protein [Chloroflexota bacterium]